MRNYSFSISNMDGSFRDNNGIMAIVARRRSADLWPTGDPRRDAGSNG